MERERGLWQGQTCTILEWPKIGRSCKIRDSYGFVWSVRKREVAKLRTNDDLRVFRT